MKIILISIGLLLLSFIKDNQSYRIHSQLKENIDTSNIVFRDTIYNLVFDSLTHNLGDIDTPHINNSKIVKYFKYIGKQPLIMGRPQRGGEPSHICNYPLGVLIPNKVYSLSFCLMHQGKKGKMAKIFTILLSDGNTLEITFKGNHL